jgi:hypothetical protein
MPMVLRLSRALSASAVASFYVALLASGCSKVEKDEEACSGEGCFVIKLCSVDGDCPSGQFCGANGKCNAECTLGDTSCPTGMECSATGKCIAKDIINPPIPIPTSGGNSSIGGIPNQAGNSGSGGSGGSCVKAEVKFSKTIPNMMLVVDRSGSMKDDFGGGGPRWNVLRDALIDPTAGFVTTLEKEVRFGLTLYTAGQMMMFPGFPGTGGRGGSGGGGGGGASGMSSGGAGGGVSLGDPAICPWLVEVPVALNNLSLISSVYKADDWQGGTPTGEALAVVWPKVRDIDQAIMPGPNYIILATDGEPNGCEGGFMSDGRPKVIQEVTNAYAAGITTYVISVGEDIGTDHLKQVANLGQGKAIDAPDDLFYVAGNTQQLVDALKQIIIGARPCEFDLEGTVDLDEAHKGTVVIDGTTVAHNDPNGWELVSDKRIKLNGTACDLIRNGAMQVNIDFPCGVFIPVVPD